MVSLITKTKLGLSALPILDGTAAHRTKHGHSILHQWMETPKDQRPLHLCAIGKPIHTGKGGRRPRPRPPFLSFSFIFSPFHLFTTDVTRALPLETIKGEAGATSKRETSQRQHLIRNSHEETWDPFSLSKACNPYYEHSGARQHEQQSNPLDIGSFLHELV
jgi:hypothetical protein